MPIKTPKHREYDEERERLDRVRDFRLPRPVTKEQGEDRDFASGRTIPSVAGRVTPCAPFLVLLAAFCFLFQLAVAADDHPSGSTVKGFQAPLEYFDAPHELQVKSYLEGSEAVPGADGVIVIRDAKLQTFREDGTNEMTVRAPQCVFDSRQHTVSSAGPLQVQTSDDHLLHEGVGFLWQQTNSLLITSNLVHTTISGPLTNSFTP